VVRTLPVSTPGPRPSWRTLPRNSRPTSPAAGRRPGQCQERGLHHGLEVGYNDKVNLVAQGPDADEAIAALVPALTRGLGDEGTAPASAPASMMVSEGAAPARARAQRTPTFS